MMATEQAIVLSDDSDASPEERAGPSVRHSIVNRKSTTGRLCSAAQGRQKNQRLPSSSKPAASSLPGFDRRRIAGTQAAVVDLTQTPDEDITCLSASEPVRPKVRRKVSPCDIILPESPLSPRPSAKCSICFQNMDGKMCCGPCGHVFCEACLRQAVKTQKKCPSCRRTLQPRQLHKVFLNT